MARSMQKRALQTRANLLAAAEEIIAESGFEALRVEEVVLRAGTAKGTFFAHFRDKDAMMDLIIGPRMDSVLEQMITDVPPASVEAVADSLMPLAEQMTCERYVFDVILRYSGAAAVEEIGPIANAFGRMIEVFAAWCEDGKFREDISADLQAEGIQAFLLQAMAANFCALHNTTSIKDRLIPYLKAWLEPVASRQELSER